MRKTLGLYANLRPAKVLPQLVSASTLKPEVVSGVDIMVRGLGLHHIVTYVYICGCGCFININMYICVGGWVGGCLWCVGIHIFKYMCGGAACHSIGVGGRGALESFGLVLSSGSITSIPP